MGLFEGVLIVAALLCALVAGLLLVFSIVVMPGIGTLSDHDFLKAFQVIDARIQNSQPVFIVIWVGSVVASIGALALAFLNADGSQLVLVVVAVATYLVGVQLPTAAVNIPLNNALQSHDLDAMDAQSLSSARTDFESSWKRWNSIRSVLAVLAALLLVIALAMT